VYPVASSALEAPESPWFDPALFVDQHLHRVYVQIYRIVKNAADAQDLTQETFIKALRCREQLHDEEKAAHWLSRIARNTAIDFLRRNDFVRRNSRASFTGVDDLQLRNDRHLRNDDNPERVLLRAEARDGLDQLLRRLTPRERAALTLRDVEGLPAEEVAKQLGCSKATVRSHIANARVKCRLFLERKHLERKYLERVSGTARRDSANAA
jgi:RNA polymerase sigma-70 factor (ECF subfamily)